jgi:hypothetical protein
MNSLKTDILGGFPWVLDDFRWHHDATREALTSIIKGLNFEGTNCRLSGVVGSYNGTTWDWSEGYLFIDGEIVKVDAQTGLDDYDVGFDYFYVTIDESFDAAGTKSLQDGGTGDAYKVRRGIINSGGTNPVGADLKITTSSIGSGDLFPFLHQVILNSNTSFSSSWSTVTAATLDALSHTNIASIDSGSIRYKQVGTVMFIEGFLTCDLGGGASNLEIELPSALDFSMDYQVWGIAQIGSSTSTSQKIGMIGSKTGGIMRILSPSGIGGSFLGATVDISFTATYRVD